VILTIKKSFKQKRKEYNSLDHLKKYKEQTYKRKGGGEGKISVREGKQPFFYRSRQREKLGAWPSGKDAHRKGMVSTRREEKGKGWAGETAMVAEKKRKRGP